MALSLQYFSFSLHFQNTRAGTKVKKSDYIAFIIRLKTRGSAMTITYIMALWWIKMLGWRGGGFKCFFSLLLRVTKKNTGFWFVNLMNKSLSMTPTPTHTCTHTHQSIARHNKIYPPPLLPALFLSLPLHICYHYIPWPTFTLVFIILCHGALWVSASRN